MSDIFFYWFCIGCGLTSGLVSGIFLVGLLAQILSSVLKIFTGGKKQ